MRASTYEKRDFTKFSTLMLEIGHKLDEELGLVELDEPEITNKFFKALDSLAGRVHHGRTNG